MSYETGGTFSPTIMGGKGGQYMGLIQFGPSERKKYGIDKASSPEDWTKAIGDYLQDRGFKRGMGVLDLYSTINAGTPAGMRQAMAMAPSLPRREPARRSQGKGEGLARRRCGFQ